MDELQKQINKMMEISEETCEKYNPSCPKNLQIISLKNGGLQDGAALQKFVNELMGITDEIWQKYGQK
jgi:hypothetical protein